MVVLLDMYKSFLIAAVGSSLIGTELLAPPKAVQNGSAAAMASNGSFEFVDTAADATQPTTGEVSGEVTHDAGLSTRIRTLETQLSAAQARIANLETELLRQDPISPAHTRLTTLGMRPMQQEIDNAALKFLRLCKWMLDYPEDLRDAVKTEANYQGCAFFADKSSSDTTCLKACVNEIARTLNPLHIDTRKTVADVVDPLLKRYFDNRGRNHFKHYHDDIRSNGQVVLHILERAKLDQEVTLPKTPDDSSCSVQ